MTSTPVARCGRRGFSLVEIMIALALAAIVAAAMLTTVRNQLIAYDINDAVMRAQQNARAGLSFVEIQLRRACGGASNGSISINIPGAQRVVDCLTIYDSAQPSGNGFAAGTATTNPDAIDIIYGTPVVNGALTLATSQNLNSTTPWVVVNDTTGIATGDLLLISNLKAAYLFKVQSIDTGTKTVTFATLTQQPVQVFTPGTDTLIVLRAVAITIYYVAGSNTIPGQLYLDPDGGNLLGTAHARAEPVVDWVVDFQVALGMDQQAGNVPANGVANDGLLAETPASARARNDDEWLFNKALESPTTPMCCTGGTPGAPCASQPCDTQATTTGNGLTWVPRQLRATLVVRTSATYPNRATSGSTLGPYEDGAALSVGNATTGYPRFRILRTVVAPRAWNLGE